MNCTPYGPRAGEGLAFCRECGRPKPKGEACPKRACGTAPRRVLPKAWARRGSGS